MIHQDTLGEDWINSLRGQLRGADPRILEKLIRAYYLTEQLVVAGLDFVFKGGTCLTLLLLLVSLLLTLGSLLAPLTVC